MASVIFVLSYLSYNAFQDFRRKRQTRRLENGDATAAMSDEKHKRKETLREKAARKLHGGKKGDQNPSQLGDPISVKAETSERVPTDAEAGARSSEDTLVGKGSEDREGGGGEKIREKKVRETRGGAKEDEANNPSLLGDPISVEREEESESGARGRGSKL